MLKLFTLLFLLYSVNAWVLPASSKLSEFLISLSLYHFVISDLASYTDAFARNEMLPLASAAYAANPQHCLDKRFKDAKLKRQIHVEKCAALSSDVCSGYTAVLHANKAIVISFRGTQGFLQLISEANKSVFEAQMAWVAGGKVSKYFGDAFMKLWKAGMKDDFSALLAQNPGYEVWVSAGFCGF